MNIVNKKRSRPDPLNHVSLQYKMLKRSVEELQ